MPHANLKPDGYLPRIVDEQVLELLARGLRNAEIAAETGLTLPTVKSHVQAAYRKLDVHAAPDAVLRARELGLL